MQVTWSIKVSSNDLSHFMGTTTVKKLNTRRDGSSGGYRNWQRWCGRDRAFQVRAAAIRKARSPTVDSRVWWTGSDEVQDVTIKEVYNLTYGRWQWLLSIKIVPQMSKKTSDQILAGEELEETSDFTWALKSNMTLEKPTTWSSGRLLWRKSFTVLG